MERFVHHDGMRDITLLAVIFLVITLTLSISTKDAKAAELSGCASCHTDEDRLDDLTAPLIAEAEGPEVSDLQQGRGYAVKQNTFDLFEKLLVKPEFLETVHGRIPCADCHKGNPDSDEVEAAHDGMVLDPTMADVEAACGKCHYKIVKSARESLHAGQDVLLKTLDERSYPVQWGSLHDKVAGQQCSSCHKGSCGSCHVSRARVNGGGLVAGHLFQKTPELVYQCASCHTIPLFNDFIGNFSLGDVHYRDGRMLCTACHGAEEMHASGSHVKDRYHLSELPECTDCHQDLEQGPIRQHAVHAERVACAVCHSQPYQNCDSCHMGVDEDDIPYSQSTPVRKGFKIGLNYDKSIPGRNPEYILVRQIPVRPDSFTAYTGDKLAHFSSLPTFKRTTPHNIQRKTWQNANCNHCHGKKEIFLRQEDVPPEDREANRDVIVPDNMIPGKVDMLKPLKITGMSIDNEVRVDAKWLHDHRNDDNLLILDIRKLGPYMKGHIPGALNLCYCHTRTNNVSNPPFMMLPPEELAKVFALRIGLTPEKRVVIYDGGQKESGIVFAALELIGHRQVSFLDGALQAWTRAGYPLEKGPGPRITASEYTPHPKKLLVDSGYIERRMEKGELVVIDARDVAQHVGHTMRGTVKYPGRIPGSYSLPIAAFFGENGMLKSVDQLNWLLGNHHIHPSMQETIVTTCNINTYASEMYMILRYLGYKNVLVHDGSWAEWSRRTAP